MKPPILLTLAILALTGCASEKLNAALPKLTGQPIETAFQYFGFPDKEIEIRGQKIYRWENQRSGSYVVPHTSYNTGTAISPYGGMATYTGQTTTYTTQSYNNQCRLDIATKDGIITSSHFDGDNGGCMKFADAVSDLAEEK